MARHRIKSLAWFVIAAAACDDAVSPESSANLTLAAAVAYSGWAPAINVEALPGSDPNFNTSALDGCPFVSRDGKTFFMASTRPGGLGGIDIWMATRAGPDDPWSEPVNAGAPINSSANDFCPTIARDGHLFFFVSTRAGGCGGADIYVTRFRGDGTLDPPENLGCDVNSAADEASPFPLPERAAGPVLYFSSLRPGGFIAEAPGAAIGDSDIYMSVSHGGVFGAAQLVEGVNSAADDAQPNVRRDGLEIFFYSTRVGTLGGPDIYSATRATAGAAWSTPVNLGPNVNSAAGETRPSLSWDGTTLYFGSNRGGGEGGGGLPDIYVTTRAVVHGSAHDLVRPTTTYLRAQAAKPNRTVISGEPFTVPAGVFCAFPVGGEPDENARRAVTEFSDGRIQIIGHGEPTLTNLDNGTSTVVVSRYERMDTFNPDSNELVTDINGRLFFVLLAGDQGPFGVVGPNGGLFGLVGRFTATLDLDADIVTAFTWSGEIYDICAVLSK